jgi:prepilin-type N-terminal cleavage/methylation domain-containing protein
MKNQRGFGAVEILVALVVIGILGFVGWYVLNRNNMPGVTEITNARDDSTGQKIVRKEDTSSSLKIGWKTVSKNGLTISYPKAWDLTDEDYQRLQVGGKVDGDIIYVGFGAPYGYQYLRGNSWEYVDAEGKKVNDTKPKAAPTGVTGADSTILVSGGDGGCGGSKVGFSYKNDLYTVSLPWECDKATTGTAGISGGVIAQDLSDVIRSIRVD